jgi:PhzF family phenazine biosynthesis protein
MSLVQRLVDHVSTFTDGPFGGNTLPVVHEADGLTPQEMIDFTQSSRQSESVFILQPTMADATIQAAIYSARGLVTAFIGAAFMCVTHSYLERTGAYAAGSNGVLKVEHAGVIRRIEWGPGGISYTAAPRNATGAPDPTMRDRIAAMLNIDPVLIEDLEYQRLTPSPRISVRVRSVGDLLNIRPGVMQFSVMVWALYDPTEGSTANAEGQVYFPAGSQGVGIDMACGESGPWLVEEMLDKGLITGPAIISQGCTYNRPSLMTVSQGPTGLVVTGPAFTAMRSVFTFQI